MVAWITINQLLVVLEKKNATLRACIHIEIAEDSIQGMERETGRSWPRVLGEIQQEDKKVDSKIKKLFGRSKTSGQ